jgi:hypothetical protein
LFLCFQSPSGGNQQKGQPQKQAAEGHSIPESSPVTVNVTQIPPQPQKYTSPADTQNGPIWSNWALVLVGAIAAFFGIKNLRAIEAQVEELRSTGKQTETLIKENIAQSKSLENSVAETARFATAMEGVAKSLEDTTRTSTETLQGLRKQMRAYLTVIVGGGTPQNRGLNLRFDARPTLLNCGPTPARNVRSQSKSAVLPNPLPGDFDQSITTDREEGGNFLGAHLNAQMLAVVEDYAPDDQVENIRLGKDLSVYVWGTVTYEDVFGDSHITRFCQRLTWLADGNVFGYYIAGRNDAD